MRPLPLRTRRPPASPLGAGAIDAGARSRHVKRPAASGFKAVSGQMTSNEPINDIYSKRLLALAADIPRLGRLAQPDGTARAVSRLCGSEVTVDIRLEGGRVADFAHEVKACALGQAASAVMGAHAVGSTKAELVRLREQMRAMLKENGPPPGEGLPPGKWDDLKYLEPVRDYKARHASTLLTFDAVVKAIEAAEAKAPAP